MKEKGEQGPKIIKSVQRAIDIIMLFSAQESQLGITEIASRLGLAKSTVAGLVSTLERNGFLDQDSETRKYRMGLRLVERAATTLDTIELRHIAFPYMAKLRDLCDESVFLGIPRRDAIVVIGRVLSSKVLGVRTGIGAALPFVGTAMGTAFLSGISPHQLSAFIEEYLAHHVEFASMQDREALLDKVSTARRIGYAVNMRGREHGITHIAAPIMDVDGHPVGAIGVSVPSVRMPDARIPEMGSKIAEIALSISSEMGYQLFRESQDS